MLSSWLSSNYCCDLVQGGLCHSHVLCLLDRLQAREGWMIMMSTHTSLGWQSHNEGIGSHASFDQFQHARVCLYLFVWDLFWQRGLGRFSITLICHSNIFQCNWDIKHNQVKNIISTFLLHLLSINQKQKYINKNSLFCRSQTVLEKWIKPTITSAVSKMREYVFRLYIICIFCTCIH